MTANCLPTLRAIRVFRYRVIHPDAWSEMSSPDRCCCLSGDGVDVGVQVQAIDAASRATGIPLDAASLSAARRSMPMSDSISADMDARNIRSRRMLDLRR